MGRSGAVAAARRDEGGRELLGLGVLVPAVVVMLVLEFKGLLAELLTSSRGPRCTTGADGCWGYGGGRGPRWNTFPA